MNAASKPITIDQVRAQLKARGWREAAWRLGSMTQKLGGSLSINPYRRGTHGYRAFIRGYDRAYCVARDGAA